MLNNDLKDSTLRDHSDPALGGSSQKARGAIRELILSGMRTPKLVVLPHGMRLYRFASTKYQPHTWVAGNWWMSEEDYHKVMSEYWKSKKVHGDEGLPVGYLARSALAVMPSWSRVDAVVKVFITEEIKAYAGLGRTQHRELLENGVYLTLPGWPDITQLFIPNVSSRGKLTPTGEKAFFVMDKRQVESFEFRPA